MVHQARRRSSTSSQNSSSSHSTSPPTYISLDPRILSPKPRRIAVTPPSVTPPCISTTGSSVSQYERDRCKSPNLQARTLLARVAAPLGSLPTSPASSETPSNSSSPGENGGFAYFAKTLNDSPTEGGYISFPEFEESSGFKEEGEQQS